MPFFSSCTGRDRPLPVGTAAPASAPSAAPAPGGDRPWYWRVLALVPLLWTAGMPLAQANTTPYCQQAPATIAQKDRLLQQAARGDRQASQQYQKLVREHARFLTQCRQRNWPRTAAIWIRLYPCDTNRWVLASVMDRIVDRGYNQVYVEAFGGGKVLLPANQNPTPWPSVAAGTRAQNEDLLAMAIQKGRERGLKVYAWLFTLNFGPDYFRRGDRRDTMAHNGLGHNSLFSTGDESFVDPYSKTARADYQRLVRAIAQRRPDGMLFDYVRYPQGRGAQSVMSKVQDLWIYGQASQTILLQRALNYQGQTLIQRYLQKGYITPADLQEVQNRFPNEDVPRWQGRQPGRVHQQPLAQQAQIIQNELWELSVSHAFQGVYEFLTTAAQPVQRQGIPTGVVFFPEGNRVIGQQGYDSRLQFWEYFPSFMQWHPMSYATCGNSGCILQQVRKVLTYAPRGTVVKPVLAGIWQEPFRNRPPLEVQMQDLYRMAPSLPSVSHFAYSWQEPGSDRDRKACRP